VTKPISTQLLEAWEADGRTLEQLLADARKLIPRSVAKRDLLGRKLRKSPLDCDFTSLSRKLHGKQGLTEIEAQALADALGYELDWGLRDEVRAS
jgi:hypothetical protein